jgi:hypothetical protein
VAEHVTKIGHYCHLPIDPMLVFLCGQLCQPLLALGFAGPGLERLHGYQGVASIAWL